MKNTYLILIIIILSLPSFLCAQYSIDTSLVMDEIHIQENRITLPVNEYGRNIDFITWTEIKQSGLTSVNELLQYQGGVDVRRRGVNGTQADIGIRGSSFNQVLILIDGVPMSDPQTGHHSMNLPLPISSIARIEILKGAAARVYGQNALAGAINIITSHYSPNEVKLEVDARGSSFNTIDFGIKALIPSKNFDQTISLNRSSSDGYQYNTDYTINNAYYQSAVKFNENKKIHLKAGITERKFGANGFYASEKFKDQYEETRTSFIALHTSPFYIKKFVIKPRISWRNNRDIYLFLRENPGFYRNEHTSNTFQSAINTQYISSLGISGFGIEYNKEDLVSNNLGNHERDIFKIFLEHRLSLLSNKLKITVGSNINKTTAQDLTFNPGIDILYRFKKRTSFFTSVNKGNRLPTFTNLYYTSPSEIGNPILEPESAISLELGAKYVHDNYKTTFSLFSRSSNNLIDWVTKDTSMVWYAENFNKVTMRGIDWINTFNVNKWMGWKKKFNLKLDYTFIDAIVEEDDEFLSSRYSLENIKHQLITGVDIGIWKQYSINAQYRYLDRVSLNNYSLLDLGLRYDSRSFSAEFKVFNLMDTEYRETNLVTMPGRYYSVGVSFR